MFFQRILVGILNYSKQLIIIFKTKSSLLYSSIKHLLTATIDAIPPFLRNSFGRTVLFISRAKKGSLTLEAAIVLPFFLFCCMAMVFFCQVFYIHCEVQGSLFQAARYISGNILYTQIAEKHDLLESAAVQKIVCVATARQKVMEYSQDKLDACVCLQNGADGLQFSYSSVTDEYVDLIVNYKIKLPYTFGINATFPVVQRCRIRAWTGASGKENQGSNEMVVYVAEHGMVYHVSADCTHLKITIRQVLASHLSQERNAGGGKYTKCEKCVNGEENKDMVYVAAEGDRYHYTLSCSGLKRTISEIPQSEAKGKRKCMRCGGNVSSEE